MMKLHPFVLVALAVVGAGCKKRPPSDDPVAVGAYLFREKCALCHPTGSESASAPGLGGVVGRKAASLPGFMFSGALQRSGLTWDRGTLDVFLRNPNAMVPGTRMPISVSAPEDRAALIAYLSTLGAAPSAPAASASSTYVSGPAFGDWHADAPGRRHKITIADLPAPFASPSARNLPSSTARPANATPLLPPGFHATALTTLKNPRQLRVAPSGDVFVAETAMNQIHVLRARDGATSLEQDSVFARGLDEPFGIAFYPPGPDPKYVYVANTNSVVRFPYTKGDLVARGAPEVIIAQISPTGGGHTTRDLAFSLDGASLYVSVGSSGNVGEEMKPDPTAVAAAEREGGLGAAWGADARRADVLVATPDGKAVSTFANGIRNCVGLVVHGADVWCTNNERDGLGDDLVPDYVTRVKRGGFYGWPWYYLGDHPDPRHKDERPDLLGKITVPDVLLQPHSAALGATFYEGAQFPAEYRGSLFVAFHGSWNRARRTSPKVVRLLFANGAPTGEYEDFMTGFVVDDRTVWGRPVGVAQAHDGALLVTEDANDTVWRIHHD